MTCEVMKRRRLPAIGTGPAPVPSITSLVPWASFSAAWTRPSAGMAVTVCAAARLMSTADSGVAAKAVRIDRRE